MIKAIQELPNFKIGEIVQVENRQYVVTGILSIFNSNDDDEEPTITFKVITQKLITEQDN